MITGPILPKATRHIKHQIAHLSVVRVAPEASSAAAAAAAAATPSVHQSGCLTVLTSGQDTGGTAAEREALEAGFKALGVRDLPPAAADASPWCYGSGDTHQPGRSP
jgi:hypothetical protein